MCACITAVRITIHFPCMAQIRSSGQKVSTIRYTYNACVHITYLAVHWSSLYWIPLFIMADQPPTPIQPPPTPPPHPQNNLKVLSRLKLITAASSRWFQPILRLKRFQACLESESFAEVVNQLRKPSPKKTSRCDNT